MSKLPLIISSAKAVSTSVQAPNRISVQLKSFLRSSFMTQKRLKHLFRRREITAFPIRTNSMILFTPPIPITEKASLMHRSRPMILFLMSSRFRLTAVTAASGAVSVSRSKSKTDSRTAICMLTAAAKFPPIGFFKKFSASAFQRSNTNPLSSSANVISCKTVLLFPSM